MKLFDNPKRWFAERGIEWPNLSSGSLIDIIERGLPELTGQTDMFNQLDNDLASAGLTAQIGTGLGVMMTGGGLEARRTTARGREFIEFITDPRADE